MDGKVQIKLIEEEMKANYIDYAMSVITSRALPDVRDGLKPVHRRVLYTMYQLGLLHNKPFKKSANVVGTCMAKYHPHGDLAIYDSLVRMAQSFSLRYPLVDGHGNFGSIDGDSAAAMRYTECRLKKISEQILADIEKETVDFLPNYDNSLKEPNVLPSKIPNLLINGSSGIAVGMATNIPPHNISEIIDLLIKLIENPELSFEEMFTLVKGPDFPSGGIICGKSGVYKAYKTGRGIIKVRALTKIEEKANKKAIIVTELPYMVNKAVLIENMADLVRDKQIIGISDIRDESDRKGMRIVLELKSSANPELILNQLYKHTQLEDSFGIIMLALVNNQPKILSLKSLALEFISHRKQVVTRRTQFELKQAEERAHILLGLKIALENIDKAIKIIKGSKEIKEAKELLIKNFKLTEKQSIAILEMRLQKLTSLETDKLKKEYEELLKLIEELKSILADENKILNVIKKELLETKKEYQDERRTQILDIEEDIEVEDLIKKEEVVVTMTHKGYIKRIPIDTYKQQKRGGSGIIATETKEEDFVENLFITNTHDYLLFFSNKGKVYWLKAYQIPSASRYAIGLNIVNLLHLEKDEIINATIPIKEFNESEYLLMATKKGLIKKTSLPAFSNPRKTGIIAIKLRQGDELVNVKLTDGQRTILLATKNGLAVKFEEKQARELGRNSMGVRGIKLRNDQVIGMEIAYDDLTLLTATENGYGKRTSIAEYRLINRGGKGVINIKTSERNGKVIAIRTVDEHHELMFITKKGILVRTSVSEISSIGRNTQGVRLIKLKDNDKLVNVARIINNNTE